MTLVLQIAAGIVLAVVILVFWRQLLALGVGFILLVILLGAVALGVIWATENRAAAEHIGQVVLGVALVGLAIWAIRDEYRRYKAKGDSANKTVLGYDEKRSEK